MLNPNQKNEIPILIPADKAHNVLAYAVDLYGSALASYEQNIDLLRRQNDDLRKRNDQLMKETVDLLRQRDSLLSRLNDFTAEEDNGPEGKIDG